MVRGNDLDDVLAAEKSLAGRERRLDIGILLIDDIRRREDGVHAVLSGYGRGSRQREEGADPDLFGGKGRRRRKEGGAKNQHNDNGGTLT
ncbi:hypothetical protein SDC9_83511 [bioreactor metagenome]|uniref:Uncharacterized protein n=1 Tax=bioreactor metagenome TaxID=1076179 RepID=A0A644Z8D0_9ZZZZ